MVLPVAYWCAGTMPRLASPSQARIPTMPTAKIPDRICHKDFPL